MPLCPQITITPITVTSTGMTQTSTVPVVAATTEELATTDANVATAIADATAAQAAAAAAQAAAASANATAIAANTAAGVAQATADGKNKVTYSTSVPGSTANAIGDIWYQYGTTSPNVGRIIAQYIGAGGTSWTQTTISGLVVANIDAGNITTGTLTAAVGISNPSGNFSVNGATGALVASSATITGAVNAISGYFGSSTNGFSISATGLVGVGSGTIITSTGSDAIILNAASNALQFKAGGSVATNVLPLVASGSVYGLVMHHGATPDAGANTYPNITLTASGVGLNYGFSNYLRIGSTGVSVNDKMSVSDTIQYPGAASGSGSTLVLVSGSNRIAFVSSSRKTKTNITALAPGSYLDKVLSMQPVSFDWKAQPTDVPYRRNFGLIAEDAYEIPEIDSIVNLDENGEPITISYDRITPFLVMAIKELNQKLDALGAE